MIHFLVDDLDNKNHGKYEQQTRRNICQTRRLLQKQGQSSHDTVKGNDYFGVGDILKKAIKVIPEVLPPLVGCIKNC